jgi:C-terminal peptidase prc
LWFESLIVAYKRQSCSVIKIFVFSPVHSARQPGRSRLRPPGPGPTLLPSATQYTPPPTLAPLNPTDTPTSLQPLASETPTEGGTPTQGIELQITTLPLSTPVPTFTPVGELPAPTSTPLPLDLQLTVFEDVWGVVNDEYLYADFNGLDWDATHDEYRARIEAGLANAEFYRAIGEMIGLLNDDHSAYLDPQSVLEEDAEYAGNLDYVGIGVLITAVPERNRAVLLSVFPGSPAEAAGLHERDSILTVDGTPILDEDGYLRDIVRGPEGTTVTLLVQTPGQEPRDVQIIRHRITGGLPVPYTVLTSPNGQRIGYVLLTTFTDSTMDEQFGDVLTAMTADAPLDGLIIDNRMNGGGADTVLRPTLAYFTSGVLGQFVSRTEERPLDVRRLTDINGSGALPVVLVGPGTVSYGEVFAGVLHDIAAPT